MEGLKGPLDYCLSLNDINWMGDNKNVKPFQLALEASKIMYVDNLKLDISFFVYYRFIFLKIVNYV